MGILNDSGYPQAQISTQDLPLFVEPEKKARKFLLIIIIAIAFAIGSAGCYFLFPRHIYAVNERNLRIQALPQDTDKKNQAVVPKFDENKSNHRIIEKVFQEFEDSGLFSGTLEIKDFEAKTVRYNKAVFKNKDGSFADLKNNMAYPIYIYFVDKESGIGHGIMGDNQKNLFRLVWYSEKIKIPATNPKTLQVPNGRRIETGNP